MLPSQISKDGYLLLNGELIAEIGCTIITDGINWEGSFQAKEGYQDKLFEVLLELAVGEGVEIDLASYRGKIILKQEQLSSDIRSAEIAFQGVSPLTRKGQ